MPRSDGAVIVSTKMDTTGIQAGLNEIQGSISKLGSGLKKIGALVGLAFGVHQLIAFSKECIALGSNLDEVQNVVDVTFGQMSGAVNKFAKDAAENFGLSELAAKQYTSTIGAMLKSSGIQQLGGWENFVKKMP